MEEEWTHNVRLIIYGNGLQAFMFLFTVSYCVKMNPLIQFQTKVNTCRVI